MTFVVETIYFYYTFANSLKIFKSAIKKQVTIVNKQTITILEDRHLPRPKDRGLSTPYEGHKAG